MTLGPHFSVTLGLDISVTVSKESLLMRNTKKTHPLQLPHTFKSRLSDAVTLGIFMRHLNSGRTSLSSSWIKRFCTEWWRPVVGHLFRSFTKRIVKNPGLDWIRLVNQSTINLQSTLFMRIQQVNRKNKTVCQKSEEKRWISLYSLLTCFLKRSTPGHPANVDVCRFTPHQTKHPGTFCVKCCVF